MEYRKEKNLFIAFEGEKVKGKYDSNTGIYYGVKGTPVKTIPSAFKDTIYANIFTSHQWIITHTTDATLNLALRRWEQLASLGLYTNNHNILIDKDYEFPALKKDLVKYIKDNNLCCYDAYIQKLYDTQKTYPEFNLLNRIFVDMVRGILFGAGYDFPLGWGISAMLRLQLEDALYLDNVYDLVRLLTHYYTHCTEMGQEPVVTKNFMITMAHTEHLYDNYKAEKMNDWLKKYNDIPQLYYENDTYVVRPLLTREDFHAEAEAQSNCVERLYMERVAQGHTHVVTIRKKNAPDTSLITCEINNDMRIIQYYAKYNRDPERAEKEFKKELTSYLASLSLSKK